MTAKVDTLPGVSRRIEGLDVDGLRQAIQEEYALVAYEEEWLDGVPEASIASFAGTGNPFSLGRLMPGEHVVDVGCGAGIDSIIAAKMVGPTGSVVGVDMTPAMVEKARAGATEAELHNLDFRQGLAESLPVADGWADVIISNAVLTLFPDKLAGLQEMARVLKPDGRLQIGDILVQKAVPEKGKQDMNLWKG